jgi:hypothetical protein
MRHSYLTNTLPSTQPADDWWITNQEAQVRIPPSWRDPHPTLPAVSGDIACCVVRSTVELVVMVVLLLVVVLVVMQLRLLLPPPPPLPLSSPLLYPQHTGVRRLKTHSAQCAALATQETGSVTTDMLTRTQSQPVTSATSRAARYATNVRQQATRRSRGPRGWPVQGMAGASSSLRQCPLWCLSP